MALVTGTGISVEGTRALVGDLILIADDYSRGNGNQRQDRSQVAARNDGAILPGIGFGADPDTHLHQFAPDILRRRRMHH